MTAFVLLCLTPAFVASYLGTWGMRWLSPRVGLIDRPAARKVHRVPTPLGGGVGIIAGVVLPLLAAQVTIWWLMRDGSSWLPESYRPYLEGAQWRSLQMWGVILAACVLGVMGLADDFRPLGWPIRLGMQFLVSGLVVWSGVRGSLFVESPLIGSLVTVFWMVLLINSFNFLDNMDGLSSGIGLIACALFATMMLSRPGDPRWLVGGFFLVMCGSLLGFLCHNWSPARIFMGDAGAYFLGFTIASMTVLGTFYRVGDSNTHVILAPLCVLAVPLYDITSVVWIRLREGRSPFQPDKRHFSHRLVALGLAPVPAVLTVHLCTLTTGLVGVLLQFLPHWGAAAIAMLIVLAVLSLVAILEAATRPVPPTAPQSPVPPSVASSATIAPHGTESGPAVRSVEPEPGPASVAISPSPAPH